MMMTYKVMNDIIVNFHLKLQDLFIVWEKHQLQICLHSEYYCQNVLLSNITETDVSGKLNVSRLLYVILFVTPAVKLKPFH